ncbi:animal RPA1 domain protein, putative [Medicago truncatula]|uniref:Animal RPA1 domain protein, putative n=1 Tax=Medicago truncatula TaxID=3880 RepID=G7KZ25_MEDTR|nr:animal RPA1 domain protein, putative [Medicago truncatula]
MARSTNPSYRTPWEMLMGDYGLAANRGHLTHVFHPANPVAFDIKTSVHNGLKENQYDGRDIMSPHEHLSRFYETCQFCVPPANITEDQKKLRLFVLGKWTVVNDGKEHLKMIIVDVEGNDIQVMIPTAYKVQYKKLIQEKSIYTLSNFQVQTNDLVFKASDHMCKLKWVGGTTDDQVNVHEIPDVVLKFKPFAEIVVGRWHHDLLIHVIGFVHKMDYCQMNEGTSKKRQVNFIDMPLNYTLWEEYAATFIKFSNERKEVGPIIVMLNVTNTYNVTQLFINEDVVEINNFNKSLLKEELFESQSQLMCTQTDSRSQFNTKDEILANNFIMPLYDII